MRRIGVMGGTFDPIHHGHLVAASEVAASFELEEVVFVPTAIPWQKDERAVSPPEDRYLMTVIATASDPRFSVSRVDIDRGGPTYTIDTLRDLHAAHPDAGELYFIAGQVSVDSAGAVVGKNDFEAQFKQVFQNLQAVLEGVGVSFDHVAKFTTYFVHSQDIEKFMALRTAYFPKLFSGPYPPNTICVIDRLVKEEFLLEVEAVARGD